MSRHTHLAFYKAGRAAEIARLGSKPARCPVCGKQYETAASKWRRSVARCHECWFASHYMRMDALSWVAKAIKLGRLLPPYTFRCTDCDGWASVYDHRDYYQPLKVEPVCQSCNMLRGPAHPFRLSA
jgi:hypothetical protein